jgi:hypothetical protein
MCYQPPSDYRVGIFRILMSLFIRQPAVGTPLNRGGRIANAIETEPEERENDRNP